MSTFSISFKPNIGEVGDCNFPQSISDMDVSSLMVRYPTQYEVSYRIDEIIFTYYPSSIITLINDLWLEFEKLLNRDNHDMTLSGYTVLKMDFKDGKVVFFDPSRDSSSLSQVGDKFDLIDIDIEFRRALSAVWNYVR